MKKVISVVGARPNFMKVAPIHRAFEKYRDSVEHMIVHTGQHYDEKMSDRFFRDLEMPHPKHFLGAGSGSHAKQTAKVMKEFEMVLEDESPDLVIVVGDVNSTIACALTAVKMGIKVAHVEAGLRSYDRTMPEEINRIATDAICDYAFVTERSGTENLLKENHDPGGIFFVGNTMIDSLKHAQQKAARIKTAASLGLQPRGYVLVTLHRPSNVDDVKQLTMLMEVFERIAERTKIAFPIHPRTRKQLQHFGLEERALKIKGLMMTEPMGYTEFLSLMTDADMVITDSGGIQEETTVLGVDCITVRTSTERPVTVEQGTNILISPSREAIIGTVNDYLDGKRKSGTIPELWDGNAAERIADIVVNKILSSENA